MSQKNKSVPKRYAAILIENNDADESFFTFRVWSFFGLLRV